MHVEIELLFGGWFGRATFCKNVLLEGSKPKDTKRALELTLEKVSCF